MVVVLVEPEVNVMDALASATQISPVAGLTYMPRGLERAGGEGDSLGISGGVGGVVEDHDATVAGIGGRRGDRRNR